MASRKSASRADADPKEALRRELRRRRRFYRTALRLGLIAVLLVAINMFTEPHLFTPVFPLAGIFEHWDDFWAKWPLLAIAFIVASYALRSFPVFAFQHPDWEERKLRELNGESSDRRGGELG